MKIASWNVNGLRSVHQKGLLDWINSTSPDVICLQEIKIDEESIPEVLRAHGEYRPYWHCGERRGYCGVSTWSRHPVEKVQYGIGDENVDREGRVLITDFGSFSLVNAYFPNSQRDHARLGFKLAFCETMLNYLEAERQKGKRLLLCGDLNIAHQEIDLRNPKTNRDNAGFLPEERDWMDRIVALGYVDCFRKFVAEGDHYTWWSYRPTIRERNVGWRLDYFVADPGLAESVVEMKHQTEVLGSDHCPIWVRLDEKLGR